MNSTSISTRLENIQMRVMEIEFPKILLLLFLESFCLHLIVVLLFINQPIALDDMYQYDMLARSLKEGNGFRWYSKADVEILRPYYSQFLDIDHLPFPPLGIKTAFRAPGYPFFLAFLYLFTSESSHFILVRLAQALLMASLAPLAAVLGNQAGMSRKACLMSAVGIGLYPILLAYPIGLASENLYIVLGMVCLILINYSINKKSWRELIFAGLICGMTLLTRSIFAAAVLLCGLWISLHHVHRWKAGLLFLLTAFGICLPWSIRNTMVMNQPSFVESSAGYNMFIGYHPEGDGGFVSKIAIMPMNILDDGDRDRYCLERAIDFILKNPAEAGSRIWVRLVKFLGPEDREFFFFYSNNLLGSIDQPWLGLTYTLLVVPWIVTLIPGCIGLWGMRKNPLVSLLVLFLTGYAFPHLLIIAEPRFHLAWVPVMMPFAAHGWLTCKSLLAEKYYKSYPLIILLSLVMVVFITSFAMNFPRLISIMSEGGNTQYFSY